MRFFVIQNGREEGPFLEEEILDLLDTGEVGPDDLCRRDGEKQRRYIGDVFQVIRPAAPEPKSPEPAPAPPQPTPAPAPAPAAAAITPAAAPVPASQAPERLLHRGQPSLLNYTRSFLLAAVCLVAGYYTGGYSGWFVFSGLALCLLISACALIHRSASQHHITTRRVEHITGLLRKSSREIRIADIRAIHISSRGLLGLLGVASIHFSATSGPEDDIAFRGIRRARRLQALVRKLQDLG